MAGAALGMMGMDAFSSAMSAKMDIRMQKRGIRWAREMAHNKYQYAVGDLKAAGLNPILAVTGGGISAGGASAPGGAPSPKPSPSAAFAAASQGAVATSKLKSEKKILKNAETESEWRAAGEYWRASMAKQNAKFLIPSQADLNNAQSTRHNTENTLAASTIESAKAAEQLYKDHPWVRWTREFLGSGSAGGSLIKKR